MCINKKNFYNFNFNHYNCAFLNFNDFEDVNDLMIIISKINNVFISINLEAVKILFHDNNSIFFFDLYVNKSELLKSIKLNLSTLSCMV